MTPGEPGGTAVISVTRLRVASVTMMPAFLAHAARILLQARRAPGLLDLRLLADRRRTFWTATAWEDQDVMTAFRVSGAHRTAMPRLADWCDEAAYVRWSGPAAEAADWAQAHRRIVADGAVTPVCRPSLRHRTKDYPPPRGQPAFRLPLRR